MDDEEFAAFYTGAVGRVTGAVYAMSGSWDEAQDIAAEAFVRAWDHRRSLDRFQHPEAWVRTVATRMAISRWRKARNSVTAWQRHGPAGHDPGPGPEHVALVAALQQISAENRRVVVLHHLCDLSVEEIAAEVGVPTGTVKSRLSRGRAALAVLLGDDETTDARTGDRADAGSQVSRA